MREVRSHQQDEIEVCLRTAGQGPGELFERAVCWAASEVVAFLAAGSRVGLRTDRERVPARDGARQRASLLAFLARVEPDDASQPDEASLASGSLRASLADEAPRAAGGRA